MAKVVPCEIYSRVVGYFRPVQNWNNGKRAEYSDRQAFSEEISMKRDFAKPEAGEAEAQEEKKEPAAAVSAEPAAANVAAEPAASVPEPAAANVAAEQDVTGVPAAPATAADVAPATAAEPPASEPEPIKEQVTEVTVNVNGSTNVSTGIAGYKIYTLPGCSKCVEVKNFLNEKNVNGKEVNLRNSDGMEDFKEFYKNYREKIRRGEDRTALLPIVALMNESGSIMGIAQSLDEVKSYL